MAGRLTFPGGGSRVLELGAYIRALSGFGSLDYRLCLWDWDGGVAQPNKLLGRTAIHTVSAAASAPENLLRVTWPLEAPVEVGQFAQVMVGVAWQTEPGPLALLGGYSGSGLRYRKELADGAGWPTSMKNSEAVTDHDMAAWIEVYTPLSGVYVVRAGEFADIDAFRVRRDGVWYDAAVMVRRGGAWRNAL